MKVLFRDQDLPVERLHPHPDNPRKEVGDISELAESIKENGIFQNLTVVRGGKGVRQKDLDAGCNYTVIIGHRRLAAAKSAGLKKVPCMIVDMDEREQAATMLLENMQRSDLTIFEQAQGFQMMLDLGVTQEDIAKKTGLSKTTVRHRLKLLELDPAELRKAQERQASITDYIELEKITDPELKNEALKKIGTSDFDWAVKSALNQISKRQKKAEWLAYLPGVAKKIESSEKNNRICLKWIQIESAELDDEMKKSIETLATESDLHYTIECNGVYAAIYGKLKAAIVEDDEIDKKIQAQKLEEKKRRIREIEDMMADSRKEFVEAFSDRRYISDLTALFLQESDLEDIDYEKVAEILGIEYESAEDSWNVTSDILASEDYEDFARYNSHKLMLAMLWTIHESNRRATLTDYAGAKYQRNKTLERWYDVLKEVGYKMSSVEKAMLNGTHRCFEDDEE